MESNRITYSGVATKFSVPEDTVKALKRAMAKTWGTIKYDIYDCFGGELAALKAFEGDYAALVTESTLDADYIVIYGGTFSEWSDLRNRNDVLELGQATWEAY